jgi:hypothetical protein
MHTCQAYCFWWRAFSVDEREDEALIPRIVQLKLNSLSLVMDGSVYHSTSQTRCYD